MDKVPSLRATKQEDTFLSALFSELYYINLISLNSYFEIQKLKKKYKKKSKS